VKYADDVVLLGKEDKVLQGVTGRPNETGRCRGLEKNVGKTKDVRISSQPSAIQIMVDQKQQKNAKGKGKAVPLQAWSGPEGSRKLRFPDYMTTAQDGGKVVSLSTGRLHPRKCSWYSFLLEAESTPGP
jgi:hypothetical protein